MLILTLPSTHQGMTTIDTSYLPDTPIQRETGAAAQQLRTIVLALHISQLRNYFQSSYYLIRTEAGDELHAVELFKLMTFESMEWHSVPYSYRICRSNASSSNKKKAM